MPLPTPIRTPVSIPNGPITPMQSEEGKDVVRRIIEVNAWRLRKLEIAIRKSLGESGPSAILRS